MSKDFENMIFENKRFSKENVDLKAENHRQMNISLNAKFVHASSEKDEVERL